MHLDYEIAKIVTLSLFHLHPATRDEIWKTKGELVMGPRVAVREYGFMVNSYHDGFLPIGESPSANQRLVLQRPDLALVRAIAWHLGAAWVNIDADGHCHSDRLPCYDDDGTVYLPTDDCWHSVLSNIDVSTLGHRMVVPSSATLLALSAGEFPH